MYTTHAHDRTYHCQIVRVKSQKKIIVSQEILNINFHQQFQKLFHLIQAGDVRFRIIAGNWFIRSIQSSLKKSFFLFFKPQTHFFFFFYILRLSFQVVFFVIFFLYKFKKYIKRREIIQSMISRYHQKIIKCGKLRTRYNS